MVRRELVPATSMLAMLLWLQPAPSHSLPINGLMKKLGYRECHETFNVNFQKCLQGFTSSNKSTLAGEDNLVDKTQLETSCRLYEELLQCLHNSLKVCYTDTTIIRVQKTLSQPWALTWNQWCGINSKSAHTLIVPKTETHNSVTPDSESTDRTGDSVEERLENPGEVRDVHGEHSKQATVKDNVDEEEVSVDERHEPGMDNSGTSNRTVVLVVLDRKSTDSQQSSITESNHIDDNILQANGSGIGRNQSSADSLKQQAFISNSDQSKHSNRMVVDNLVQKVRNNSHEDNFSGNIFTKVGNSNKTVDKRVTRHQLVSEKMPDGNNLHYTKSKKTTKPVDSHFVSKFKVKFEQTIKSKNDQLLQFNKYSIDQVFRDRRRSIKVFEKVSNKSPVSEYTIEQDGTRQQYKSSPQQLFNTVLSRLLLGK